MKLKKLIEEHKRTFSRALVVGLIITIIAYSLGVLFVDIIGLKYYIAGLILSPVIFTTKYILNKYWVFKKIENGKIK